MSGWGFAADRKALPSPPGSGSWYTEPWYSTRSPRMARRTISTVSRSRVTERRNGIPCQPSITCGPLTPRPRWKRPPDMALRLIAVMAIRAGVRVPAWRMAVPRRIRDVRAATNASGVTPS
jgi:hypothetical protein